MNKFVALCITVAATAISAITLSPQAAADHESVGGGTWSAANSNSPCTLITHADVPYTVCPGSWINLPLGESDYIKVPLASNQWVSCTTYTPGGQLFESDIEDLADVPQKQQFWAEKGWGVYEPYAMCQLW